MICYTKKKIIVIIGHSGSGKTSLGLKIAKEFKKNIISADSRQVYKGLDYCTNKLPMDEKFKREEGFWGVGGIKYYGYDLVNTDEIFSAFDFCNFANELLEKEKENPPLIVGGTGMYITALLNNYSLKKIPANLKLRKKLEKNSTTELLGLLKKNGIDVDSLNNSEKNNKQRLIRKLEILSQQPVSGIIPNRDNPQKGLTLLEIVPNKCVPKIVGLYKTNFKDKIKNWVESNFEIMASEVQQLLLKYPNSPLFNGFIFNEIREYLNSNMDKKTTKEKIYYEYLHYIKRQKTYFKKYFPTCVWFNNSQNAFEYVKKNL